ncbi:hypothetical protein Q7C36_010965 [Tachysurus vachellii]|uniref:Uncharacterized protein n=1 Tax=Tachysurus vachellii TaxID=175792 RepID=A0AA88MVI0_TACVA|nr:hypothetical protein Q7C36_010965 [Tachysurus vachellii]
MVGLNRSVTWRDKFPIPGKRTPIINVGTSIRHDRVPHMKWLQIHNMEHTSILSSAHIGHTQSLQASGTHNIVHPNQAASAIKSLQASKGRDAVQAAGEAVATMVIQERAQRCSSGCWRGRGYYGHSGESTGGRRETSTGSGKTDRRSPSEQPQSKTTNSSPASSSTTLEQGRMESSTRSETTDRRPPKEQPQITTISAPTSSSTTLEKAKQQPHSSLPLVFSIVAALLLVIVGVMAFICWRRKGRRCGKNMITEGRRKENHQTVPDVTYSTVSHIHTAREARVQFNVGEKTEYASIVTN